MASASCRRCAVSIGVHRIAGSRRTADGRSSRWRRDGWPDHRAVPAYHAPDGASAEAASRRPFFIDSGRRTSHAFARRHLVVAKFRKRPRNPAFGLVHRLIPQHVEGCDRGVDVG